MQSMRKRICGLKQSDIHSNSSEFQKSNADERKWKLGRTSGVLRGQQQGTVGCPSTGGCWKLEIMYFNGYYAHVRIPLDELSAKLTKFGSHTPILPIYTRKTAKKGAILRVLCDKKGFTCERSSICMCADSL